jgi:hypothetical protein
MLALDPNQLERKNKKLENEYRLERLMKVLKMKFKKGAEVCTRNVIENISEI